jgi:hypothetical protein
MPRASSPKTVACVCSPTTRLNGTPSRCSERPHPSRVCSGSRRVGHKDGGADDARWLRTSARFRAFSAKDRPHWSPAYTVGSRVRTFLWSGALQMPLTPIASRCSLPTVAFARRRGVPPALPSSATRGSRSGLQPSRIWAVRDGKPPSGEHPSGRRSGSLHVRLLPVAMKAAVHRIRLVRPTLPWIRQAWKRPR